LGIGDRWHDGEQVRLKVDQEVQYFDHPANDNVA
jgi:hypothetical protein